MLTRTIDHIEQELLALESVVSRARARQVELLREADEAQVCSVDGARTLADWVAGRLDLHPVTARALSTVARAESRVLAGELADGEVSFDRVTATLRLVHAGADESTVSRSMGIAVNNITALCARHRMLSSGDDRDLHLERELTAQPNLDNTQWQLRGRLPAGDGELVFDALDATADSLFSDSGPARPALRQRRADALVTWAMDVTDPAGASRRSTHPALPRGQAVVFVDAALAAASSGRAGVTTRRGMKVGPAVLDEIVCSGTVSVTVECDDSVHTAARTGAAIPPTVRHAVWNRDVGCTIDGCTSGYRLEPHHIRHRHEGGDHSLSNLTLLCWYHHHVAIHRSGFRLDPESPPGRRRLLPPRRHHRREADPPGPSP